LRAAIGDPPCEVGEVEGVGQGGCRGLGEGRRRRLGPVDPGAEDRIDQLGGLDLSGADAPGREEVEGLPRRGVAQLAAEEGITDTRRVWLLVGRDHDPRFEEQLAKDGVRVEFLAGVQAHELRGQRLGRVLQLGPVAEGQPITRTEDLRLEVAARPAEGQRREIG